MPQEPIPLVNLQESGHESLAGASPSAMNVVVDGKGALLRRPAIAPATGITSDVIDAAGVVGVRRAGGNVYAVGSAALRRVYKLGGSSQSLTATWLQGVAGAARPVFAETEMLLVIAAGAEPQKVELATDLSSRLQDSSGTGVPLASHVVANSNRLLLNDLGERTKVRYSDQAQGTTTYAGHEDWSVASGTGGFFTAEARPDPIEAIAENTSELFLFGSTNVEIFQADPALVYSQVAVREYGCAAPYSIINADQSMFWLDNRRRLVMSDGRSVDDTLADPIQADLKAMATVSDAFGYRVKTGPIDCLVWTFPTAGKTYAFQKGSGWAQWAGRANSNWAPFLVNCHHHRNDNDEELVGTTDGRVLQLTMDANTDMGDDVVAFVETGSINRGTDRLKQCTSVKLTFERGQSTTATVGFLEWSDRPGTWSAPRPLNMGIAGDTNPVLELRSLGTYRRRAWRFTFSGDADLKLIGAEEEFEVLEV